MSLEQKIDDLIAALRENTAAVKGAPAAAGTKSAPAADAGKPAKADAGKPAKAEAGKKAVPFETVKAALVRVKDEVSKPAAQKIIKDVGGAAAMADIPEAKFAAVIAACETALAPPAEEEAPAEGDDGL